MRNRIMLTLAGVLCLFAAPTFAQQTLGSVNGTILDSSGAAVPGAVVTINDPDINVTRTVTTQGDGYFQIFNLPIGIYKVKATHDGFDTTQLSGISVTEAHATTVSVSLAVGQVATSIDVTETPLLNATDATNGYTLDAAQIASLPLQATGSPLGAALLSPGINGELTANLDTNSGLGNPPIWANGQRDTSNTFQVNGVDATNLFNGKSSSGASGQRLAFNIGQGSPVGGASGVGTSVFGSNGNSLPSPPPEFIQELRVNTSMYDAQQGATSGAQIDINTLSGTNTLHGQVYGTFANNDINAAPYFFKQQALLADEGVGAFPNSLANPYLNRWTTGATVGGPVKKDKLFFYLSYQHRANSDQGTGLSQLTVPSGLTDDRSAAGLDAAASSWAGASTAPYTGAISPLASALFNAKLANGQYLIPSAQTNAPFQFGVPNVTLVSTSHLTADQAAGALDYDVNRADRLSVKYYYQNDPVRKQFGYSQTGGFPTTQANGAQVFAIDNTIVIGSRLNWEQRLGFDRMGSYSYFEQTLPCSDTLGCDYGIGAGSSGLAAGLPGLTLSRFAINSSTSPALSTGPNSAFVNTGYHQNRLNPSTNVIYTLGRHTLIAGGGYSYTQLDIENNRQGYAQITTKTFETFLQDSTKDISKATVLESTANGHNQSDRYYRSNEIAGYAQDKWQATPNLSITFGVRYDYHGGLTEKYGNIFNFDPSRFNVTGTVATGFNVTDAGFVIAGNNATNPTRGTTDSTLTGRQWGVSPKFGFAWSPKYFNNKVVINGGAGIYYDRGELFTYLSQPAGSGNGGPFGVTESTPLASFVTGNGNSLGNPIGTANTGSSYVGPSSDPTTITRALQAVLGSGPAGANGYSGAAHGTAGSGQNCSGVDNQDNFTDCPDALNFGAYDKNNVLPYTINWALNLQWQPRNDLSLGIGYSGNRGRHAVVPIPFNEPGIATATNPIHGETSTYGFEVLNQNEATGGAYQSAYLPIANEPWNSEDGGNADFRVPYIGFSPNAADFKTVGNSAYDALQTHLEKRLSHNIAGGVSYTWSHALDEQSDIGLFFTGNNPNNLRQSYASADFDRTHVFTVNFTALLPNVAKAHTLLAAVTNDWSLNGIGVVQSGQPYSLYEFYGAVGSAYFGDFPTLMNPVLPIKNPSQAKSGALTGNNGARRGTGGSFIPTIDPSQIDINYLAPGQKGIPVSTGTDPQDIYETDFAPTNQRNIFRQALQKRADISVRKSFHIHDRIAILYNFDVYNLFNTTSLDIPQDQTEIRSADACSTTANAVADSNCASDFINYGQVATSNNATDQASALTNLDRLPFHNGSGKATTIPTTLTVGQGSCTAGTINSTTCANNGANFGSVTGTIGGNRAVIMGLHITY